VLFAVVGALASSACYTPRSPFLCEFRALAHPTMTPVDLSSAMDLRVRAASEGAAVGHDAHAHDDPYR
jgi:hypothetical protein